MYKWICLFLLAATVGCGSPSFLITPVKATADLEEVQLRGGTGWGGGKIVIINLDGMIANAQTGGLLQPSENPMSLFQQQLDKISGDSDVKGLVLRVNSPGGTVSGSDAMYTLLMRYKHRTHVPVVASVQELCASGAYYISCAADRIVTQPTSVVGSVGVIFETFDASGTMQKIGLKAEPIKSGTNKDMGSPFKPLGNPEREIMQGMVNEYFDRFKSIVREHRAIKDADFALVSDGRVFSGTRSVEIGLADQTGLLEDAIDLCRSMAHAPGAKVVTFRRPYAYNGSIYANSSIPAPQTNVLQLQLPGERSLLPSGFYYLWQP